MDNETERSNALGITTLILGFLSMFIISPVLVPVAIILGIIGVFKNQLLFSITGLIFAFVGLVTSPILLVGLIGVLSIFGLN